MSEDILARLRWLQNDMMGQHSITAREAADEIERLRDDNAKLRGEVEVLLHMRERREELADIVEINCEHDWTRSDHNGDMLMWPICSECGEPMPKGGTYDE